MIGDALNFFSIDFLIDVVHFLILTTVFARIIISTAAAQVSTTQLCCPAVAPVSRLAVQSHLTRSMTAFGAEGRGVMTGTHALPSSFQPNDSGGGSSGLATLSMLQISAWYLALMIACRSAACVGGNLSDWACFSRNRILLKYLTLSIAVPGI